MVYCCIYGCNNSSKNYSKSFHRIPKVISHHGEQTESISKERREKWFTIINRKDMKKDSDYRVCAEHFVSGMPAKLFYKSHPDWVPTVNFVGITRLFTCSLSIITMDRLLYRIGLLRLSE